MDQKTPDLKLSSAPPSQFKDRSAATTWADAFSQPQSIAIIGASSEPGSLSGRPLEILRQHNYSGRIYLVNPNRSEIGGIRTYDSIKRVPETADLALVVVPAELVFGVVRECAQAGVRSVAIFSAGFSEADRTDIGAESALGQLTQQSGMRIAGPNCEGFVNLWEDIAVGFSPALDYQRGLTKSLKAGSIAIISQSGGLGFALLSEGQSRGLGFSYVFTTGNECDLDALDYLELCLGDSNTQVIAMFIEGLKNGARFSELARTATELGKPIVVAKVGRSKSGQRAVMSHTAHLAGSEIAYRAAFKKAGVIQVEGPDELIDVLTALSALPRMNGGSVAVLTVSGGAGAWLADALETSGLTVPELDKQALHRVFSVLPRHASGRNPIDTTAQVVEHGGLGEALRILLEFDYIDAVAIALSLAVPDLLEREEPMLRALLEHEQKPIVIYSYTPPTEASVQIIKKLGIPLFPTPARTASVLKSMMNSSTPTPTRNLELNGSSDMTHDKHEDRRVLCDYEVKEALRELGVVTPREMLAKNEREAIQAAEEIGGLVALKVQSPEVVHKSGVGGVLLGLSGRDAVAKGYRQVLEKVSRSVPDAEIRGVLVQEMAPPGLEMMVGRVQDEIFGAIVLVAHGGVNVELIHDTACQIAPVNQSEAMAMIRSLTVWPRFADVGVAVDDVESLASLLSVVSDGSIDLDGAVYELDLNPVVVYGAGGGICVVDAKGVVRRR